MTRYIILTICCAIGLSTLSSGQTAWGETPPIPARKTGDLSHVQDKLEQEQKRERRLKKERDAAAKELERKKKELVKSAASIQDNETLLQSLEKRIKTLSDEQGDITTRLEDDYGAMADLILALERMRRIPPEALIVRPGAPLQIAQTASLLKHILPSINHRAITLSEDLKRLQSIRNTLDKDRSLALETKAALDLKHKELAAQIEKRNKLYKRTNSDYKNAAAAAKQLSKEARSLQDLIATMQQEKTKQASLRRIGPSTGALPKIGSPRLPVTGLLLTGFGEKDKIGAKSQGVRIQARPAAIVVAPMGGIIRYAGTFKHYGQMIIIEHSNNYHSLIAGMSKINAIVGQKQKAGEPIGILPSSSSRGGDPALYYELRHKGRAVNPSTKFSDLKS